MAPVSTRQCLEDSAENGYGMPAFHVNNPEQLRAMMQASSEPASPVIVQASAGARKAAGEPFSRQLIVAAKSVCKARFEAFGAAGSAQQIKPIPRESMAEPDAAEGESIAKAA